MSHSVLATDPNDGYHHHTMGIRPYCGICGGLVASGERFMALFGNSNSTSYLHRTESLELLASGHNVCFVEFRCRRPDCGECDSDAETATVHSDCLQLFAREYKLEHVLDRLWVIAAWRSPWRGAHNLRLAEARLFMPDLSAAEALDLLKLRDLPPEILNWIRIYSPTSLFWRYSSVLELARGLSKAAASESACKDILSIPLPLIWTWKRGELPVSIAPSEVSAPAISPKAPIIRLTIDSYGLREVERLQEKPPYRTWRSDHLAYVIVEEHSLKHAVMHFKFGLSRLQFLEPVLGLQIWDSPNPPDLRRCLVSAHMPRSGRFHSIALQPERTTGITFFFSHEQVYAIHAHTATAPCAEVTYERLPDLRQKKGRWMYIPLPENDRVLSFGVRQKLTDNRGGLRLCILLRTSLMGDIIIGPPYSSVDSLDKVLSKRPPEILIYNTVKIGAISMIGAYSSDASRHHDEGLVAPFRPSQAGTPPFFDAYFSSAPLEHVVGIRVFEEEKDGFCRGILLEYKNGGQRALGQCRVGVDPARVCRKPVRICLFRTTRLWSTSYRYLRPQSERVVQAARVESSTDHHHSHDEEGWICSPLKGNLEFWFSHIQTNIKVTVNEQ